ncbi:ASF1 like histone chaperone-domain-containing protein [Hyaloraphidium curvatum]|nr:ASF1 like histone chaperone-domain-containing protein [Hyaloraphidium curvatum]
MALVNLTNVAVLDNPAPFGDPLKLEITFECLAPGLKDDIEFKVIYVGSAESEEYDQELDSILVGPVPIGLNKFVFEAEPPDATKLPENDVIGVTVILLKCSYLGKEFVRVGYYVNNDYVDEALKETPREKVQFDKLYRNILSEKPRVTRFSIQWDDSVPADDAPPEEAGPEGEVSDGSTKHEEGAGAMDVDRVKGDDMSGADGEGSESDGEDEDSEDSEEDDETDAAAEVDLEAEGEVASEKATEAPA